MNETNAQKPKKSGTVLKVVLVLITLISLIAAGALGLLYYNASTNLELVREKNIALGEDRDKYKEQVAEYEVQIEGYKEEIEDLAKQLAEAEALISTPTLAGQEGNNVIQQQVAADPNDTQDDGQTPAAETETDRIKAAKTLDVVPKEINETGKTYSVIVKGLNMRSGPGSSYRTVASVYASNVVTAYGQDGDWLCVKNADGVYGWVASNYVKATG